MGQSAMLPLQSAIPTELTPEHMRERIYSAQFAVLNLSIRIDGLVSSLVVTLDNQEHLRFCLLAMVFHTLSI
jgi:hypothetical protein